ncbi:MAG: hypothetical protein KDE27_06045 [Planctomycetes bacterium]|nr:hypothetical protein [Planctomycetota bacterium]
MSDLVQQTAEGLVLYPRRSRLVLFLVLCLGFVTVGSWMALRGDSPSVTAVGVVAIVFAGLGGWYFVRRLAVRSPVLEIDRDGLVDSASGVAVGRVAWGEIADLSIGGVGQQRFLGIHVHDRAALLSRVRPWRRVVIRLNAAFGFPPVNLPQSVLPLPIEELAEILERALLAWRNEHGE